MKKVKRQVAATALAVVLASSSIPGNVVLATDENGYNAQVVAEANADKKMLKTGDIVTVTCFIKGADWAQMSKGTGLASMTLKLDYDNSILEFVKDSEQFGPAIQDALSYRGFNSREDIGRVIFLVGSNDLSKEASFSSNDVLVSCKFKVKELPTGFEGPVENLLKWNTVSLSFGDADAEGEGNSWKLQGVTITPEINTNEIGYDTKAPSVSLDGSAAQPNQTYQFYYQPVTVAANDTYNIQSVTLDGQALAAPYTLTKGGTLVVTDTNGNQTTVTIKMDSAAYDKAKAAIAALPETIGFGDKALVEAAINAAAAVTDNMAKSKLDLEKLNNAETQLKKLEEQRTALVKKIAESKLTVSLKQEDIKVITDLRSEVESMTKLGASFTANELKNLTDAESELKTLQNRSQAAHKAIAALPTAESTVWSDSAKLSSVQEEVRALMALGDTFSEEEQARISAVQEALKQISALKEKAEQAIAEIVKAEISPELATKVSDVKDQLEVLEKKGVSSNQVKGYDELLAVEKQIQDMVDQIDAVSALIKALPAPQDITFTSETDIQKAEKALEDLQKNGLDVSAELKATLSNVQKALADLKSQRSDLVQEIANSNLTISLTQDAQNAISSLRSKVDDLNAKGAAFTQEELKKLTDAESSLADLKKQSKAVHDRIAALPTQEDTVWSNAATLSKLKEDMAQMQTKGDTFTQEEQAKISAVEAGLDAINQQIKAVENDIQKLVDAGEPSPALATQVNEVKQQIAALTEKGVPTTEISGYNTFIEIAAKVQDMLDKIQAVTDQIKALPAAKDIVFGSEDAINQAQKALEELQKDGLDVDENTAQLLKDAQAALAQLKADRSALVQEIADSQLTVSLKQEDVDAVDALRNKVDALNAKGAAFTQEELKKLTDAEAVLRPLQQRSQTAHANLAGLPTAENTRWSDKSIADKLPQEMADLTKMGDTFTQQEQDKLTTVQKALTEIQAKADALRISMEQLPSTADGNSAALLTQIQQQMRGVSDLGYPTDQSGLGETAIQKYNTFLAAVDKYNQEQQNNNNNNNTNDSVSSNNNSSNNSGAATATPAPAPAATRKPSTAVIKKPSSSQTAESESQSEATATPKPTEKPAASSSASSSKPDASSQAEPTDITPQKSSNKLVQIIIGAVVVVGAAVAGVFYWLTKKRDS